MDQSFSAAEDALTDEAYAHWLDGRARRFSNKDIFNLYGLELVGVAHKIFGEELSALSAFSSESAYLLSMVAEVNKNIRVLFIDTQKLHSETLDYKSDLIRHLGLRNVQTIVPDPLEVAAEDPEPVSDLWQRERVKCCDLRKVRPLEKALTGLRQRPPTIMERLQNPLNHMAHGMSGRIALLNGARRGHGRGRTEMRNITITSDRVEFSPLANLSDADVAGIFQDRGLPVHPLRDQYRNGFACNTPACTTDQGKWAGEEEAKRVCYINRSDLQNNSLDSAQL